MSKLLGIDGTYTHPASDVTELDAVVISPGGSPDDVQFIRTIDLDLSALTENATIRLKSKIDRTNYRTRYGTGPTGGTIAWTTADEPWVQFQVGMVTDDDVKVTVQSAVGEAAPRDIPYHIGYEA